MQLQCTYYQIPTSSMLWDFRTLCISCSVWNKAGFKTHLNMLKNVLRNSPSLVDFFNNIIVSPLVFWHLAYGQLFSSYLQ